MAMGCGMSMIKYLVFIFNLLCALCGIAILTVGIVALLQVEYITNILSEHNAEVAPISFIILGSIIFVISFFGCCGAIRESGCMLTTYSIFLMILIVIQIIAGVLVLVYGVDFEQIIVDALRKLWENYPNNQNVWLGLQRDWRCCGFDGPADFGVINIVTLPESCCANEAQICTIANAFEGCKHVIGGWIPTAAHTLGGVILGLAAIEFIGVVFACCLANTIRNNERRSAY